MPEAPNLSLLKAANLEKYCFPDSLIKVNVSYLKASCHTTTTELYFILVCFIAIAILVLIFTSLNLIL